MMLCDAQTSGGLLVAIPLHSAGGFEQAMQAAPFPAVRIGAMREDGLIRLDR
jgi:selenophosphate synthase